MLAVAAVISAMSIGYWLVVIKDSKNGKIDFRNTNRGGRRHETVSKYSTGL